MTMWLAAQLVQDRQKRIIEAASSAGIKFALCGSNATAAWIASVDESGVRQVRNVEVLLNRADYARALTAFLQKGFEERTLKSGVYLFDVEKFRRRFANEIVFAGETASGPCGEYRAPSTNEIDLVSDIPIIKLQSLVRFQLARYRLDDAVDISDMIDVGLVNQSWTSWLDPVLAARLQKLLDDPDG